MNLLVSTLTGTCCSCCLLWRHVCKLQAGHGNSVSDSRDSVVDNQRIHAFWSAWCREPGFWSFDGNVRRKEAFVLISFPVPALDLYCLDLIYLHVLDNSDWGLTKSLRQFLHVLEIKLWLVYWFRNFLYHSIWFLPWYCNQYHIYTNVTI